MEPGSIERIDLSSGVESTYVANLAEPSGLSFDAAGNLFFGNVSPMPLKVQLVERRLDGTLHDLGAVVDTSAGNVTIGGWAFDTAIAVPEPSALVPFCIAALGLIRRRRGDESQIT